MDLFCDLFRDFCDLEIGDVFRQFHRWLMVTVHSLLQQNDPSLSGCFRKFRCIYIYIDVKTIHSDIFCWGQIDHPTKKQLAELICRVSDITMEVSIMIKPNVCIFTGKGWFSAPSEDLHFWKLTNRWLEWLDPEWRCEIPVEKRDISLLLLMEEILHLGPGMYKTQE